MLTKQWPKQRLQGTARKQRLLALLAPSPRAPEPHHVGRLGYFAAALDLHYHRLMHPRILLGVALLLLAQHALAEGQPRVAFITAWGDPRLEEPLWNRLRELRWVPGKNITVDRRELGEQIDRVPALTTGFLNAGATVFVVPTAGVAARVREVTHTVPIVTLGMPGEAVLYCRLMVGDRHGLEAPHNG